MISRGRSGLIFLFIIVLMAGGCASTKWNFEREAVRLHLQADSRLNTYGEGPHTLLLCVYFLSDPNAFNETMEEKEGLSKLLECGRFDRSVARIKRLVIQPGQTSTELLDRAEGARYVGVAAGYYSMEKEGSTRLFAIPVTWLMKNPAMLDIDLYLGPQEMQTRKAGR